MARSRLIGRLERVARRIPGDTKNPLRAVSDAELHFIIAALKASQEGEPEPPLPDGVDRARIDQTLTDFVAFSEVGGKH
jgi:hypothetical protein